MEKNRLHKHSHIIIRSTVVLITTLALINLYGCKNHDSNSQDIESIKKVLEEKLKIGTSFENVESYLKEEGIEHSYVKESKSFIAIVRNINKNNFVSESLSITVKIGDDNEVKELILKLVHTGP